MAQLVDRDGNAVQLDDPAAAQAAVASGELGLRGDQEANLVDADGQVVVFDPQDAAALLADPGSGFRLASDAEVQADIDRAEYSDVGSQLAAAGEGALAGATLGASDYAIQAGLLGAQFAEESRKRAEHAAVARGAGEVAGIVGSSLLTGGATGAAATGARGAGLARTAAGLGARAISAPARAAMGLGRAAEGVVGRALAKEGAGLGARALARGAAVGAAGAVEGAAFGAGQALSETSLDRTVFEDPDLAAERIVTGAGLGALFGGGAGAALGAGGVLAGAAGKATKDAVLKRINAGTIEDFVNERAFKAVLGGRNLRRVKLAERRHGGAAKIGRDALDEGVVTATSTIDDIARAAEQKTEQWGQRVGDLIDQLDNTGARIDGKAAALKIRDDVLEPLRKQAATKQFADQAEAKLEPLLSKLDDGEISVSEFWAERRALDKTINFESLGQSPVRDVIKDARRTMEDVFEESTDKLAQSAGIEGFADDLATAKRKYSNMIFARDTAREAIERDTANRFFSPSDYGVGSILSAAEAVTGGGLDAGTLATGFMSGLIHKTMRERGSAFIAGTLDSLQRMRPGKAVMQAQAGQRSVETASGAIIARLKGAATKTAKAAKEATTFLGVEFGRGADAAAYRELGKRVRSMQNPASDSRQQARRTTGQALSVQPAMTASMDATIQRAADHLAPKFTSVGPDDADGMFAHVRRPHVSQEDIRAIKAAVERVANPNSMLERAADGSLSLEDVEALQAVYPRIYDEMRQTVIDRLHEIEEMPRYADRMQLGILFDLPTDPSLEPEFIASMQQSAANAPQFVDDTGPVTTPGNFKPPETADMYATKTSGILSGE